MPRFLLSLNSLAFARYWAVRELSRIFRSLGFLLLLTPARGANGARIFHDTRLDMDKLKSLSNSHLLKKTQSLIAEERKTTREILDCLREIDRRKLHLEQGFPNLWEFTVNHLGYSAGAAQRRISAMRLMAQIPEVAGKIESGSLSLSNLAQAQHAIRKNPEAITDRRAFVLSLEGLSSRECERKIAAVLPHSARPADRERMVTPTWTEIRFSADDALMAKLQRVRELAAHSGMLRAEYNLLFHWMADLAIKKLDPVQGRKNACAQTSDVATRVGTEDLLFSTPEVTATLLPTPEVTETLPPTPEVKTATLLTTPEAEFTSLPLTSEAQALRPQSPTPPTSRHIPAATRRFIWQRARGQCEYRNSEGKRCSAQAFLQIDHSLPYALGGGHDSRNLRLYCSAHNVFAATQVFGAKYMRKYVGSR